MLTSESIKPEAFLPDEDSTPSPLGRVLEYKLERQVANFFCESANLALSCAASGALRLTLYTGGLWDSEPTLAIANPGAQPLPVALDSEANGEVAVRCGDFRVTVRLADASVSVEHGSATLCDNLELRRTSHGRSSVLLPKGDATHFYGLGETTGYLDKRGEAYTMWNSDVYAPHVPEMESLYVSIPFLIQLDPGTAAGWFLDNPGRSRFDLRSHVDAVEVTTETGGIDLYVVPGPSMKDVIGRYTELTGRMPMPPRWAVGYHQSRYSYMDESEVRELVGAFRAKDIPLDAVYLDIHYMDGYRVFTFDPDRFPNPVAMVSEVREAGVHIVPIVDPGVKQDPLYPTYRDGVEEDVFCKSLEGDIFIGDVWPGASAFPDFSEDEVRAWWKKQQLFYLQVGIDGIWNDMNEPAVFNELKTMNPHIMHGNNGKPKTHAELHNLYGLWMAEATYQGLREGLQGERPFLLTRAAYSGVQRYGAVWTGDNRSFWEHMAMAIPMVLNMGLSGVPFAGPDVGGFAHHTSAELLVRWTQMGAFFPFFRNHSALGTVRQEPWTFGPETEAILKRYISLRYRLMPYLYSAFHEASATGLPVMRPLVMEYPDDPATYNLYDEFLVGRDLLVAPVIQPGATCRMVYLPAGTWVNFWTGERRAGGGHVLADAPLDTLPLFVRAGAVIPEGPLYQSAMDYVSEAPVILHVYEGEPGESTEFVLYEDDGHSLDYEQGVYNEVEVRVTRTDDGVRVSLRHLHRGFSQGAKSAAVCLHRASGQVSEIPVADIAEERTVLFPV